MSKFKSALSDVRFVTRKIICMSHKDARKLHPYISKRKGVKSTYTRDAVFILEYDATRIQWDAIIAFIENSGITLKKNFFTGLRYRWYAFVDNNLKDHAEYLPEVTTKG
ncbi:MAG: hypothetical protein GY840_23245, partial [Pseudoalteromonas sp.]|nr:hypothetical protein [Pseudoalteromonas sp.]